MFHCARNAIITGNLMGAAGAKVAVLLLALARPVRVVQPEQGMTAPRPMAHDREVYSEVRATTAANRPENNFIPLS